MAEDSHFMSIENSVRKLNLCKKNIINLLHSFYEFHGLLPLCNLYIRHLLSKKALNL